MIALVGDHLSRGLRGGRAADEIEHGLGLCQGAGQGPGVTLVGRMDPSRHDHAGIEIDGVLRLVREMRRAILHLADPCLGIGFGPPLGIRQRLVLARPVETDQVRCARGLDAALLGQAAQHLLVILAGIPADQATQRGVGLLSRGVHADPFAAHQIVLVGDFQNEAEDHVVDFQRQPRACHAQGRMVGDRLAVRQAPFPDIAYG